MEILSAVYAEVNRYYVDEVNPTEMMRTGIDAMLENLDPYTTYIPEDDIEDFRFISTGQYGGIGSVIGNRNESVYILMPYEGFPAEKAGLKIGDEIVEVGGKSMIGKNTDEISSVLKGEAGTAVEIGVKRYGQEQILHFTITREKIKVKNVPYAGMVTEDIGYFHLSSFTNNATDEIESAISDLKVKGAKKIIFDLRGNTGGLLKEAIGISNLFIPKGKEIVSTKGKIERWNSVSYANKAAFDSEIPLVILTNGRSASASEIVSGVMQDYDRGVLIGRQTYGKGLVQATFDIPYNSKVKVTTAKYYIPSGRCIQAIDYSHKDEEGNPLQIPDSLLVPFKTLSGRQVFDGAGITPDIDVELPKLSNATVALLKQHIVFDFATKYYYAHQDLKLESGKAFTLSDEAYQDFLAFVEGKAFDYEIPLEKSLDKFKKELQKDTLHLNVQEEIESIKKKIGDIKSKELEHSKAEIREKLEEEIVGRYLLQRGTIEASFDDDKDIEEACRILNDTEAYQEVLNPS
jgi:carboxyl-terminal processing protease